MSATKRLKMGEFAVGRHPEMISRGMLGLLKGVEMSRKDRNHAIALEKLANRCKTPEGWEQIWLDLEDLAEVYMPDFTVINVQDNGPAKIEPAWGLIEQTAPTLINRVRTQLTTAAPYAIEERGGISTLYRKVRLGRGHRWQEVWSATTPAPDVQPDPAADLKRGFLDPGHDPRD